MSKGNILVAPLNWGLGHATRCIPIIDALIEEDYTPIIASDGPALELLRKEFPELEYYELPPLNIKYSKYSFLFKFYLLFQVYKLYKCSIEEQKFIKKFVKQKKLKGIISDNRLGLYHKDVPTAIITHQINVFSGETTWISSKLHRFFIYKYNECWIPDNEERPNLSGKLGHINKTRLNLKYTGLLSRFNPTKVEIKYDVLILISGPEKQRQVFEDIMIKEFRSYKGKVALVQGKVEEKQKEYKDDGIKIFNFLKSHELEILIQESDVVISRSGYSTLMDLAKLNKKAFLIPTPDQAEQQYLAMRMKKRGIAPYAQQHKFNLNMFRDAKLYDGFDKFLTDNDAVLRNCFNLFDRK